VRAGERVAALSAFCLLAFSFLDWYGAEPAGDAHFPTSAGGNAWQTLGPVLVVLVATVAAALATAALRLARSKWRPGVPLNAVVAVLGGLSVLLILFRIVDPPGLGAVGGIPLEATLSAGAFLSLLAACGVAYGGYRAMGEEGASFESIAARLGSQRGPRTRAR
jgi:hypothetical protein